jgi:hypothetical protein
MNELGDKMDTLQSIVDVVGPVGIEELKQSLCKEIIEKLRTDADLQNLLSPTMSGVSGTTTTRRSRLKVDQLPKLRNKVDVDDWIDEIDAILDDGNHDDQEVIELLPRILEQNPREFYGSLKRAEKQAMNTWALWKECLRENLRVSDWLETNRTKYIERCLQPNESADTYFFSKCKLYRRVYGEDAPHSQLVFDLKLGLRPRLFRTMLRPEFRRDMTPAEFRRLMNDLELDSRPEYAKKITKNQDRDNKNGKNGDRDDKNDTGKNGENGGKKKHCVVPGCKEDHFASDHPGIEKIKPQKPCSKCGKDHWSFLCDKTSKNPKYSIQQTEIVPEDESESGKVLARRV